MFATELADAFSSTLGIEPPLMLPVREDFDESEMIGYEKLNGEPFFRDFTAEVVLTERPLEPRVVIIEEFNLAVVERYLSSVLIASQDKQRRLRLPGGVEHHLPVDTFIIATCNSYRDEPETRTRLSTPTKRRSTVITMPNVLWLRVSELPNGVDDAAFETLIVSLAVDQIKSARRSGRRADRSGSSDYLRQRSRPGARHRRRSKRSFP